LTLPKDIPPEPSGMLAPDKQRAAFSHHNRLPGGCAHTRLLSTAPMPAKSRLRPTNHCAAPSHQCIDVPRIRSISTARRAWHSQKSACALFRGIRMIVRIACPLHLPRGSVLAGFDSRVSIAASTSVTGADMTSRRGIAEDTRHADADPRAQILAFGADGGC